MLQRSNYHKAAMRCTSQLPRMSQVSRQPGEQCEGDCYKSEEDLTHSSEKHRLWQAEARPASVYQLCTQRQSIVFVYSLRKPLLKNQKL